MTSELATLLHGLPVLRGLPSDLLLELEKAIVRRSLTPGEYLFRQGQGPLTRVYYLVSATAQTLLGPPENERPLSLSRPGQIVGWIGTSTADMFPVSARIVVPGEVLEISVEVLRDLIGRHPEVGLALVSEMARYLKELFEGLRAETPTDPLRRANLFPFRTRVGAVMSGSVVSLEEGASALDAAVAMKEFRVGSVVVGSGPPPWGIVTEQDLVRRVFAEGKDPQQIPLFEIMTTPVASLRPDDYLYKALGIMRGRHMRHVVVADRDRVVGILSLRSLITLASSDTLELAERIEGADRVEDLVQANTMSRALCVRLVEEGISGDEVSQLLSRINRDLHCRVLEICMAQLRAEGRGEPPVPFCFILMGSHGRSENHFNTDQDHGMILADYPPEEWGRVEPYFMELGERISKGLARVGFPLCRGNVMSSNPVWRKPMGEWKEQVRGWFANPSSNAVRYSTLFYDFQPVWGDDSLSRELRAFITHGIQRNFQLLQCLYQEASRHRVPLGLFRNFVTERSGAYKGQMDLKRSGFLFLEECGRILALRHGVTQTGTVERLHVLSEKGTMAREESELIQTAYRTLLHFLLKEQVRKIQAGGPVDNYIDPQRLPLQERYVLRHALEAVGRLQGIVHASFGDIFS